jgi:phospholipase C
VTRKLLVLVVLLVGLVVTPAALAGGPATSAVEPIAHVVIQFDENMSFDHVLGNYCKNAVRYSPCNVDPTTGQPFDISAPYTVNAPGGGTETEMPFVAPTSRPPSSTRMPPWSRA